MRFIYRLKLSRKMSLLSLVFALTTAHAIVWAEEPVDGKNDPPPDCDCYMEYVSELTCDRCIAVRYDLKGTPICGVDKDAKCTDGTKLADCAGTASYYCSPSLDAADPEACCEQGLVIQLTNPYCGLSTPSNKCKCDFAASENLIEGYVCS